MALGTVTTANITNSRATPPGTKGGIAIVAGAASGTAITVASATSSGAGTQSGNITMITSAPSVLCSGCSYTNLQANTNGAINVVSISSTGNVDLRAGGDLSATSIAAAGAGASNGGQIGIVVDNNGTSANTFIVGGSGVDAVGTLTAGAGAGGQGGIGVVSNGTGGITLANQSALVLSPIASGSGGQIGLNASNGTLTTPGTWNLNATGQGSGGFLNLAGASIKFTNDLNVTANGAGAGDGANGGKVTITATNLTLPATAAAISVSGSGSNGEGGSVTIAGAQNTTLGAGLTVHAAGSGGGQGGDINLTANNTLTLGTGTVLLDASAVDGFGGSVTISAAATSQGTADLTVNANSSTNGGGSIAMFAGAWTATSGATTFNAGSDGSDAGLISINATTITDGSGAITANATSTSSGFGGVINFTATDITAGTGNIALTANGEFGGGDITLNIASYSGNAVMALNANGAGTTDGAGGAIVINGLRANSSLSFGSQAGQISASATGYSLDGFEERGGSITVSTGANLTVDGSGVDVATTSPNGPGGLLILYCRQQRTGHHRFDRHRCRQRQRQRRCGHHRPYVRRHTYPQQRRCRRSGRQQSRQY